jgi:AraC-like DNA-binding protein
MPGTRLLSRYTLTRSNNSDELLNAVSNSFAVPVRPLGSPDPRSVHELRAICSPECTVGLISSDLQVRLGQGRGTYSLLLAISGEMLIERAGRRILNDVTNAGVLNPGGSQVLIPGAGGVESLGILLSAELVEEQLAALLGYPPDGPVRFDLALDLGQPCSAGIRMVIDAILHQWDSEEQLFDHPAIRQVQLRSLATSLLLAHRHNFTDALGTGHSPLRPRPLRRALEYIDANLGEHLTMADIAAAAGCSARTVADAFHAHLDIAPMTHVRQRRLERTRAELLNGTDSVTTIATRWGFTHLGRFALSYSQQFGELPSDTLRRR